jgi:uncharacterized protein YacL
MQYSVGESQVVNIAIGFLGGIILAGLLIGTGSIFQRFNLRSFNTAILGLFCGYLMGQAILFILSGILDLNPASAPAFYAPLRFFVFMITTYLGLTMTAKAVGEIHISIPFIEFKQTTFKKKDILIDVSVLTDPRIIDLASSGLLDYHLIMPRFAVKELQAQLENSDEAIKARARRSLEVIKKLESIPSLDLRYVDTDFPEITDPMAKLVRIARFLDTNIITSDLNRIQQSSIEGVKIINIHMLSHALKPITQAGESINIKIQRYGKEARQGVGYLDDGTMVVVNGGAEFIGESIKAYVLSVKHTSSGRMIFCNAAEEGSLLSGEGDEDDDDFMPLTTDLDTKKNFLAL